MEYLIWGGAAVSLAGVAALLWCVVLALRVRRSALDKDTLRLRLQKIAVLNMAALFISAIGLMMVVGGILLR